VQIAAARNDINTGCGLDIAAGGITFSDVVVLAGDPAKGKAIQFPDRCMSLEFGLDVKF
jgi:hypothetical protein